MTVLSIVSIITVYAVFLGSYTPGGDVTVLGLGSANIMYSLDNATNWQSPLTSSGVGVAWYSRLEITSTTGYKGPVTLTWQLELENETDTWIPIAGASMSTSVALTGGVQTVYASSNGDATTNYDWGSHVTTPGTYRVVVSASSA